MLENLKLRAKYGGFLFLADARCGIPWLKTHHHLELELNLVARGSITYIIGKNRFTFGRGEILWLFPGQPHRLIDRTPDALYYVAVFKPSLIARCCHQPETAVLGKRRPAGNAVLHATMPPVMLELIKGMMDSLIQGNLDHETLNKEAGFGITPGFRYEHANADLLNSGLAHILHLAWVNQLASSSECRAVQLHPAVLKALDLLKADFETGSLENLAGQCGVSHSYLSRIFHRQVGMPINRYRNTMRLERFWEIRKSSKFRMNISEAVYQAGFGSYSQFHKVYRATYGRGPRGQSTGEANPPRGSPTTD
jgi:AraC-like DNA-binding protein